ncbi:hypothetical protein REPUB_Repub02eG0077800 [Reevesia pubescens]
MMNMRKLIVDFDSIIAVNWCMKIELRPWRYWEYFSQIDLLVSKVGGVEFKKIFREANGMADHLAKVGVTQSSFFKAWW